jgi:hypothetical protein
MTAFVMSSAVETSLIIFWGKSKRFLDFARNDKQREEIKNFAHKLCDTK